LSDQHLDLECDANDLSNGIFLGIDVFVIVIDYNNYYSLQIQQRIVGVSNGDLLGAIQSVIEIDDNGKIYIKEQYLLLFDR